MRRFTLLSLTICVVLLLAAPTTLSARDNWTSVRSKHLLVIGNGTDKEMRQVAVRLEQFREAVAQVFPKPGSDSIVPTTVIVFKDDASYRPFKTSENNAGYFQPGQDVNYITLSTEARGDQDHFNIIFHEYTHLIVNNSVGTSPAWFNEGLAELYSTLSIINDRSVVLGRPISRHLTSLRHSPMLPLRLLFQVDYKSPYYNEGEKQSIFYAESWALMHYLMLNRNGERAGQVMTFLELLRSQEPIDRAFQKAFATSIENIESELQTYIQQDRYRSIESFFTSKGKADLQMTSAAVSDAEVRAYLGDLLLHSNRIEAESYLQKALELNPSLNFAQASLGILRFRQGRMEDALALLGRAVGDSQNALVHYYYASALSKPKQDGTSPTLGNSNEVAVKARSALKRAIALRQDFAESYNLLAYVNLVTSTDIDETIELLKGALARSPNKIDFIYMLGQLYMHKDDYKQARPLLEQVASTTTDSRVRQHSQKLLSTMTSIEEQQAQRAAARIARGLNPLSQPTLGAAANQATPDPSWELREALRIPAPGESQAQGILLSIECEPTGLVFVVKTDDGTLRLRTDNFQQIKRTTFTADVKGSITCGARRPENPVVVCYVASNDKRAKTDGVLRSVEFVPGDFRLTSATP